MVTSTAQAPGTQSVIVVAGIIWNPERTALLLTLRKPEQHQGDRWEFPGGKVWIFQKLISRLLSICSQVIRRLYAD